MRLGANIIPAAAEETLQRERPCGTAGGGGGGGNKGIIRDIMLLLPVSMMRKVVIFAKALSHAPQRNFHPSSYGLKSPLSPAASSLD